MTDTEGSDPTWRNWSGRLAAHGDLRHVRTEADAAGIAADAASRGRTVRVAGSGHSHTPLVPNDHTIVAGAAATGTHGTGVDLGNFSTSVIGARIALATGDMIDSSSTRNADLWQVARLNLGALGVVTLLELQLRDAYKLRERRAIRPFDDVEPELADLVRNSRHYEFFWLPDRDLCVEKIIDETEDEPEYPMAGEGSRVGWNYEVLPSHREWLHTEMEYSVPIELGPQCMAAIRQMVLADFPEMPWAVEYRTLAADDVWMSTAYQRDTVTISMHQAVDENEEPMFRAAEEIFRSFHGRPHWGKLSYLSGDQLALLHPRWTDWWAVRDTHDPSGAFSNDHLKNLRPAP